MLISAESFRLGAISLYLRSLQIIPLQYNNLFFIEFILKKCIVSILWACTVLGPAVEGPALGGSMPSWGEVCPALTTALVLRIVLRAKEVGFEDAFITFKKCFIVYTLHALGAQEKH